MVIEDAEVQRLEVIIREASKGNRSTINVVFRLRGRNVILLVAVVVSSWVVSDGFSIDWLEGLGRGASDGHDRDFQIG